MNEEYKTLMAQYGITGSPKMMYFYKQYRQENLVDARNYARIDHLRADKNSRSPSDIRTRYLTMDAMRDNGRLAVMSASM
jgi:hypothetical protein